MTVFLVLAVLLLFLHMPHIFLFFLLVFLVPAVLTHTLTPVETVPHVSPYPQYHFAFLPLLQGLMMIDNKGLFIHRLVPWTVFTT